MTDHFKRWRIGSFASGATSLKRDAGHWRVLGFYRMWLDDPSFGKSWSFSIFGLFFIEKADWHPLRWAFASLTFNPARHNLGKREERAARRRANKRMAAPERLS